MGSWITSYAKAARYMGVKTPYLRSLVESGQLAGYIPYEGACPRFSTEDMDAIVRSWPRAGNALAQGQLRRARQVGKHLEEG